MWLVWRSRLLFQGNATMPETAKDAILRILRRLPRRESKQDKLEREKELEGLALVIVTGAAIGQVEEAQRLRPAGSSKAARMLEELREHLAAVVDCIETMPMEAHSALEAAREHSDDQRRTNEEVGVWRSSDRCPDPLAFSDAAFVLAAAVERAAQILAANPDIAYGRPRKRSASEVTRAAALTFERLTGMKFAFAADGDGQASAFLEEVFAALDITANTEHRIRVFREETAARRKIPPA